MKSNAERQRDYRARLVSGDVEGELRARIAYLEGCLSDALTSLRNVTGFVTGSVTVSGVARVSDSPLRSDLTADKERESLGSDAREPLRSLRNDGVTEPAAEAQSGARIRTPSAPSSGERYVTPKDEIDAELHATAELCCVQDIPGAWLKFCGYHAGKFLNVPGQWQAWCVREAKRERQERDRRPVSNGSYVRPPETQEDPWAVRRRLKAREDEFDRQALALRKQTGAPQKIGGVGQ